MLTTSSFQDDRHPNPQADADAAVNAFDATRMRRETGTAFVASQHTSSNSGEAAISDAFIDGSTLGEATRPGGATAKVPGTPGFPGNTDWPPAFSGRQVTP